MNQFRSALFMSNPVLQQEFQWIKTFCYRQIVFKLNSLSLWSPNAFDKEKRSMNILLNISFCTLQKKVRHMGSRAVVQLEAAIRNGCILLCKVHGMQRKTAERCYLILCTRRQKVQAARSSVPCQRKQSPVQAMFELLMVCEQRCSKS